MDIDAFQRHAKKTKNTSDIDVLAFGLISEAGEVVSTIKKLMIRDDREDLVLRRRLETELGDTLWYLAMTAEYYNLSMSQVANNNISKINQIFGEAELTSFQDGFAVEEQLPDKMIVEFKNQGGVPVLTSIVVDGIVMGSPLTDNTPEDTGYRFHDVFHFTFWAFLGWSPVLRKLLNRKRRAPAYDSV